ncbi:unnamed protein product [Bathycoccus prasinos]
MRSEQITRLPGRGDTIQIGIAEKGLTFRSLANTSAWNFQQGAMLQWFVMDILGSDLWRIPMVVGSHHDFGWNGMLFINDGSGMYLVNTKNHYVVKVGSKLELGGTGGHGTFAYGEFGRKNPNIVLTDQRFGRHRDSSIYCKDTETISNAHLWTVYVFEPDVTNFELLSNLKTEKAWNNVNLVNAAAWYCDTELEFYKDKRAKKTGGSLIRSKYNTDEFFTTAAIDLARFIKSRTKREDYLFMKMDIEGSDPIGTESTKTTGMVSRAFIRTTTVSRREQLTRHLAAKVRRAKYLARDANNLFEPRRFTSIAEVSAQLRSRVTGTNTYFSNLPYFDIYYKLVT